MVCGRKHPVDMRGLLRFVREILVKATPAVTASKHFPVQERFQKPVLEPAFGVPDIDGKALRTAHRVNPGGAYFTVHC